ncbi:hypothetical protein N0M98_11845 [Paenibacillus doosanensis]|uniref:hypothetical protein n=1 Tax=Paenibacillus doosanensis TaxID=1229154 RepID=UPI00217F9B9D|nr:hypothetical protein [Paenibacillus doosanensis]MCS7460836.1 hypothetical protein [Paenibacillus doosanensis]
MKVAFYRSQDSNILRNSIFTEMLSSHLNGEHSVDMIMDDNKSVCLSRIAQADIVFIFAHGSHWGVFHKFEDATGEERAKLDWLFKASEENVKLLNGKKVLAFTCFSAMPNVDGLGEVAVKKHDCKVYFGFQDKINRTFPQEFLENLPPNDQRAKNFISLVYSNVFDYCIREAFSKNLTFKQFAQLTKHLLNKEIVRRITHEYGRTVHLSLHDKGARPVKITADSILVHGLENEKFCS